MERYRHRVPTTVDEWAEVAAIGAEIAPHRSIPSRKANLQAALYAANRAGGLQQRTLEEGLALVE